MQPNKLNKSGINSFWRGDIVYTEMLGFPLSTQPTDRRSHLGCLLPFFPLQNKHTLFFIHRHLSRNIFLYLFILFKFGIAAISSMFLTLEGQISYHYLGQIFFPQSET